MRDNDGSLPECLHLLRREHSHPFRVLPEGPNRCMGIDLAAEQDAEAVAALSDSIFSQRAESTIRPSASHRKQVTSQDGRGRRRSGPDLAGERQIGKPVTGGHRVRAIWCPWPDSCHAAGNQGGDAGPAVQLDFHQ
jgi:hypothetical protein